MTWEAGHLRCLQRSEVILETLGLGCVFGSWAPGECGRARAACSGEEQKGLQRVPPGATDCGSPNVDLMQHGIPSPSFVSMNCSSTEMDGFLFCQSRSWELRTVELAGGSTNLDTHPPLGLVCLWDASSTPVRGG